MGFFFNVHANSGKSYLMAVYHDIARAVVDEGTVTAFCLMGDGNLALLASLSALGVRLVRGRHENAVVAMADGYSRVGEDAVGVVSVTCGPGVTQIPTSLTASARRGTPLVVLAGDVPISELHHLQQFDLGPLVRSTGAAYRRVHSNDRPSDEIRAAFHEARNKRVPVVVGLPMDVQDQESFGEPKTARFPITKSDTEVPDPMSLDRVAHCLRQAERPIVLAGAGALAADAKAALLEVALRSGALLATTLRAKGLFEGRPFDIGVAGGFSTERARGLLKGCDLLVAFGTSLDHYTTDGGSLFPHAKVLRVDIAPQVLSGRTAPVDYEVRGDARLTAEGILNRLPAVTEPVRYRLQVDPSTLPGPPVDSEPKAVLEPGTLDPRLVMESLSNCLPKNSRVVIGAGHFWHFAVMYLHGLSPRAWHFTYDFGVVGQALPVAIGLASAEDDICLIVIDGDGGLLMNIQELETLAREQRPILIIAMNDGAYGAEVHKLAARGLDTSLATFGRVDFAAVATSFGHRGLTLEAVGYLEGIVQRFILDKKTTLVDVPVSAAVISPPYRRAYLTERLDAHPF